MTDYVSKGAIISEDQKYRYMLWREWRGTGLDENWRWWSDDNGKPVLDGAGAQLGEPKSCVFIMLNPSTADGETDDPTIRRCVAFAKAWGFDRLEVVNLFAYRATSPKVLLALNHADDPVGHRNQHYVKAVANDAGKIICAWGAHGSHIGQDETLLGWIDDYPRHTMGLTLSGQPRHPLYLPGDLTPVLWRK